MRLPRPVRRRNSIVLTSLVDVMFVLLFFFMLAASAVERRAVSIGMPVTPQGEGSESRVLRLDLLSATHWTLNDAPLEPAALDSRLRDSAAREVLIRPATGVPVQTLADALTTVRDSGLVLRLARIEAP